MPVVVRPQHCQQRATGSGAGFTLIELVVVIALLSMLSLLSLPLLMDNGERAEKRSLRRIAGVVKQLYNEATLTRDEHLLTFDLDRNRLTAFRLQHKGDLIESEPFGRELQLSALQLQQVDVEGKGSFRTGRVSVRIFPLGWMEQTQILLGLESGGTASLLFSPLTGTAKIEDGNSLLQ